jgi:hypothetical protein
MAAETWAERMPMHRIRTGVSVNLRLDIYSDGRGHLYFADDTTFNLALPDKRVMQAALNELWERGVREALARSPFVG